MSTAPTDVYTRALNAARGLSDREIRDELAAMSPDLDVEARRALVDVAKLRHIHVRPWPQQHRIVVTTAPRVDGYRVRETLDVISAEVAVGMSALADMLVNVRDVVGGRSKVTQQTLRELRVACLKELRREAWEMDADAVIAVQLSYSEFAAHGRSMLFLVAAGTAVQLATDP